MEIVPSVASFFADDDQLMQLSSAYRVLSPKTDNCLIKYQVISRSDGNVQFAMSLPESALKSFIDTLVALGELTSNMNRQAIFHAAQNRPVDLNQELERESYLEKFGKEACEIYDGHISRGMEVNEAISRTRTELKNREFAFATYDIVKAALRKAGRFRHLRKSRRKD